MRKTSVVAAERAPRAENASRRASSNAEPKPAARFGYLKFAILVAITLLPWVAIIYVARLVFSGR